jgi:uncharacterized membrane protein
LLRRSHGGGISAAQRETHRGGRRVEDTYNQIAGRGIERLAALSDGLFAIAMTLIVLEIRVPQPEAVHTESDLCHALLGLAPRLVTYLMSFLTLGIFWVGQQTLLNQFKHTDRDLSWINLAFLAFVAIMPFSTDLLAEFITFRTALLIYWVNVLLLGVTLYASWSYASRAGLVKDDTTAEVHGAVRRRIIVAQTLYAIGAALCVINTYWSIAFLVLVQLNYALAPRFRLLSRLTT